MWTIHMRATYNFGCCRYGRMNHLNQLDRWKWDVVVVSLIQPAGSRGVFTHFDQNTAVVKLSTGRTLCITCWMILCKFLRIVVSLDVAIWVAWTDISGLRKVGSLWDCFLSRARQAGGSGRGRFSQNMWSGKEGGAKQVAFLKIFGVFTNANTLFPAKKRAFMYACFGTVSFQSLILLQMHVQQI